MSSCDNFFSLSMDTVISKAELVLTIEDLPFCDEFEHWLCRSACRAGRSSNEICRANHWSRQGLHYVMISPNPFTEVNYG